MLLSQTSKKWSTLLFTSLCVATTLSGCGPGFKSGQAADSVNVSSNSGDPIQPPTQSGWDQVDLVGKASLNPYSKATLIDFDRTNQTLGVKIPLPSNPLGVGLTGDIPELPGATYGLYVDSQGKWSLGVKIPIRYLVKGVQIGEPRTLPNGDPLPGVPSGELPVLGLKISQSNMDFFVYVGLNAAAVYIPVTQFNPYLNLTFPIENQNQKKIIGYFSTVAEKQVGPMVYPGGFYVSAVIPPEIARLIDGLL